MKKFMIKVLGLVGFFMAIIASIAQSETAFGVFFIVGMFVAGVGICALAIFLHEKMLKAEYEKEMEWENCEL